MLAQYLADVVLEGLENVVGNGGNTSTQIGLVNQIVTLIQNTTQEADFATLSVDQRAERPVSTAIECFGSAAIYQQVVREFQSHGDPPHIFPKIGKHSPQCNPP